MNGLRALAIGILALAGLPGNSLAQVQDGAGLFHPDTVAQINKKLRSLQQTYHRDVLIETVKELSAEDRKSLTGVTRQNQLGHIFAQIGERLAQEKEINGVYILIVADPSYKFVQVTAWPAEEPPLTRLACNRARKAFISGLKHSGPDQALFDLVGELQQGFEARLVSSVPWWILGLVIGSLLLVWIGALAIRSRLAGPASAEKPCEGSTGEYQLLPALMGGMFGSVAGHWIYDKSFQQESGPSPRPGNGTVVTSGFPLPLGDAPQPKHQEGDELAHDTPETSEFMVGDLGPKDEAESRS